MWAFWTILLIVVTVLLLLYSITGEGWIKGVAGQLYAWCFLAVVLIVGINISEPTPTALDVYRGNTELKITSVNGIPTDSVVVFKNK